MRGSLHCAPVEMTNGVGGASEEREDTEVLRDAQNDGVWVR